MNAHASNRIGYFSRARTDDVRNQIICTALAVDRTVCGRRHDVIGAAFYV
jgi:hypothetical protein